MESVVQSQWLRLDQGQWLGLDQGKVSPRRLGVVKFVDFFRINFCIISVLQLLMVSRISKKKYFFFDGKRCRNRVEVYVVISQKNVWRFA